MIHYTQMELGIRVSLFSRLLIPFRGLDVIARHTCSFVIDNSQIELRRDISLRGRLEVLIDNFRFILRNSFPLLIHMILPCSGLVLFLLSCFALFLRYWGILTNSTFASLPHAFQSFLGFRVSLGRRFSIPLYSLVFIFGNASAFFVHLTQIILSNGNSLFCGFRKPSHGFFIVLGNTIAFFVHQCQIVLGLGVVLLRRLQVPFCRFFIILLDTLSFLIHPTQIELGLGVILLGCLQEPRDGFIIVLGNPLTGEVHQSEISLRNSITLLGRDLDVG